MQMSAIENELVCEFSISLFFNIWIYEKGIENILDVNTKIGNTRDDENNDRGKKRSASMWKADSWGAINKSRLSVKAKQQLNGRTRRYNNDISTKQFPGSQNVKLETMHSFICGGPQEEIDWKIAEGVMLRKLGMFLKQKLKSNLCLWHFISLRTKIFKLLEWFRRYYILGD